jgi:hypothetical protein
MILYAEFSTASGVARQIFCDVAFTNFSKVLKLDSD